jgi:RNA polymerase sigma-70 factor (ECF subfamily)
MNRIFAVPEGAVSETEALATERAPAESDAAFTELFSIEFPKVFRTALDLVGEPEAARDVTQEAFARLYQHWRKVSQYDRPGAWVRRVAIRLATRSLRNIFMQRRTTELVGTAQGPEGADPDLTRAILALPAQQRAAVVLFYFEELPIIEISEILGSSEGAVKVLLHRGRKRLGEILGEEVEDVAR